LEPSELLALFATIAAQWYPPDAFDSGDRHWRGGVGFLHRPARNWKKTANRANLGVKAAV